MLFGCYICITVLLARPTYPSGKFQDFLCRLGYLSSCKTGFIRFLIITFFCPLKFKPIMLFLFMKKLVLVSSFNGWYYYILKCLLEASYIFFSIYGICVRESIRPSDVSFWDVRGKMIPHKFNSTFLLTSQYYH